MKKIYPTERISTHTYTQDDSIRNDRRMNLSFLVVLEPLTPFLYQQKGERGQSITLETFEKSKRVPHMTGVGYSPIDSCARFIEEFVYLELYFNQLLKLVIDDGFNFERWRRLEILIGSDRLTLRAKTSIMHKLDDSLWKRVSGRFDKLQELRNNLAHSPVGPYTYNKKELDWLEVDRDMVETTTILLEEYKARQSSLLDALKKSGFKISGV